MSFIMIGPKKLFFILLSCTTFLLLNKNENSIAAARNVGLNYGLLGNNLPSPSRVISLFNSINITKIRIFEPNTQVLDALRGHHEIGVIVGIDNHDLAAVAASEQAVKGWFATHIEPYLYTVKITYITVGNEVIPGPMGPYVFPIVQSLTKLVNSRKLPILITTSVPTNNLGQSYPPSAGLFTPQGREQLVPVLKFLSGTKTPLMVNIYTFYPYAKDSIHVSLDYAVFKSQKTVVKDGSLNYSNLFDAMYDAFLWAMEKEGVENVPILVSETGWPSAGYGDKTTPQIAATYNRNFIKHVKSGKGTPKRPNQRIEGLIFATFNENQKDPGFERYFGLYDPVDLKPIYKVF